MKRSRLVHLILSSGTLTLLGSLALVFGEGAVLPYVTGGILAGIGALLLTDKESSKSGLFSLAVGGTFLVNAFFDLALMSVLGFASLTGAAYLAYKAYKGVKALR